MRIALACPYAWDAPGGVQVHVRELAERLEGKGHDVVVLAPAWDRPADPYVRVVGRPTRVRYQGTVAPICPTPRSWRWIGAVLRAFRPEILHAHEPFTPSTALYATLASKVPVVGTFHAYADRSRLLGSAAPLLRPAWKKLRVRVAVSRAAAAFVSNRFDGDVRVIPNGCDVEAFARATPATGLPEGRRILWVGRLDPQKGFRIALDAFATLAATEPDLSLVVIGDGQDRAMLDTLPGALRERVVSLGAVPHDQLAPFYAAADAFVAPATGQESFGIVLVEAMAAGVPVVASDIPGYREVVRDGEQGILVPAGDIPALTHGLRRVLADRALAQRLGGAGRVHARRYRWETVVREIEGVYREALEPRARAEERPAADHAAIRGLLRRRPSSTSRGEPAAQDLGGG
jgi:phosphatidylinositol alpha-mannosyltransferase